MQSVRLATLISIAALVGACALNACSDGAAPPPLGDFNDGGRDATANIPPCSIPMAGCPCQDAGEKVFCGTVYRTSGTHVDCSKGYITCEATGSWGACLGPQIYDGANANER